MQKYVTGELTVLHTTNGDGVMDEFVMQSAFLQFVGVKFVKQVELPSHDRSVRSVTYSYCGNTFTEEFAKSVCQGIYASFPKCRVAVVECSDGMPSNVFYSENINREELSFIWQLANTTAHQRYMIQKNRFDAAMTAAMNQIGPQFYKP